MSDENNPYNPVNQSAAKRSRQRQATAAPWGLVRDDFAIAQWHLVGPEGRRDPIGVLYGSEGDPNHALILAAPELYEALRAIIESGGEDLYSNGLAALRKARGKENDE